MTMNLTVRVDADGRTFKDPPQMLFHIDDTYTWARLMEMIVTEADIDDKDSTHLAAFYLPKVYRRTTLTPRRTDAHVIACYERGPEELHHLDGTTLTIGETDCGRGVEQYNSFWGLFDFGSEHWFRCRVELAR